MHDFEWKLPGVSNRISERIQRTTAVAERLASAGDPQLRWLGQWLAISLKEFPAIDPDVCAIPGEAMASVGRIGAEWEAFVAEFATRAADEAFAWQLARIGTELRRFNEIQEAGAVARDCKTAARGLVNRARDPVLGHEMRCVEHVARDVGKSLQSQRTLHVETLLSNIGVLIVAGDYARLGAGAADVVALGQALALTGHSVY